MLKEHDVMKLPEGKHCFGDYLWLAVKGASRSWVVRGPVMNGKRREARPRLGRQSLAGARAQEPRRPPRTVAQRARPGRREARGQGSRDQAQDLRRGRRGGDREKPARAGKSRLRATARRSRNGAGTPWRPASRSAGSSSTRSTIADIKSVIQPYWEREQLDAASSLRKRIEAILDYATAHGWRAGDNPASWKIFKHLWPGAQSKPDVHHAALPWRDCPEFFQRLHQSETTSARLVEFILLTATRSNEARGATWSEIDFDAKVWTIPAARMKMNRDHDVPLSDQAIALLRRMEAERAGSDFVFVGGRGAGAKAQGKPMRNAALWMLMQRATGSAEATTHGFRSFVPRLVRRHRRRSRARRALHRPQGRQRRRERLRPVEPDRAQAADHGGLGRVRRRLAGQRGAVREEGGVTLRIEASAATCPPTENNR